MPSTSIRAIIISFQGSELTEDVELLSKKCKRIGWHTKVHWLPTSSSVAAQDAFEAIYRSIIADTHSDIVVLYYGGYAFWDETQIVEIDRWKWHPGPVDKKVPFCAEHTTTVAPWSRFHSLATVASGPKNIFFLLHCPFNPARFQSWPRRGGAAAGRNMQIVALDEMYSEPTLDAGYKENGSCSALGCQSSEVVGVPDMILVTRQEKLDYPYFDGWRTALLAVFLESELKSGKMTVKNLVDRLRERGNVELFFESPRGMSLVGDPDDVVFPRISRLRRVVSRMRDIVSM